MICKYRDAENGMCSLRSAQMCIRDRDSVDDIPVFEAKILVHLNPKTAFNDAGDNR